MADERIDLTDPNAQKPTRVNRGNLFSALTGRDQPVDVSGRGESVERMLGALAGTSRRTRKLDTAAAAEALGVSRRTVQRWLQAERAGEPTPIREQTMDTLRKRSRQAATTRRGRRQAMSEARRRPRRARPAKVRVFGQQGPKRENQYYIRERMTELQITPEQYEGMLDAYERGGDAAVADYLATIWDQDYLDGWGFHSISKLEID